ncbi:hypothetical protein ALC53_02501 [Atta colombica]|uniref:Mutator-like transposase domain-containing protein n=1 Tax=Atta colombica TaxID=520822 RepID=A0A195BSJ1_9HYME|nr:hypothetical protein ALC53_02501 [Atta colombica]
MIPVVQSTYSNHQKYITQGRFICLRFFSKTSRGNKRNTEKEYEDTSELMFPETARGKKGDFTVCVSSITGYCTGKILDFIVKLRYCKECAYWSTRQNTAEYEETLPSFAVNYTNYIGDGDSKTYSAIVNTVPYGNSININKKKCVGRSEAYRQSTPSIKSKNKDLGGRNKLIGKMIGKLSIYYDLAIRRNCDSKDKIKTSIWETFYHYSSTDEKSHLENCLEDSDSWCNWQRAKADIENDIYRNVILLHMVELKKKI